MPTELVDLLEFLHHGNKTIRHLATENLVGYSHAQPAIFKADNLTPIKDLKLLVKDYDPIAKDALTILINLSADPVILENLVSDEEFITSVLTRVTDPKLVTASELTMLIANLSKHTTFQRILNLKLPVRKALATSSLAIDHLLSVFLLGQDGKYNKTCTYDYLAYSFAELAKFPEARKYFTTIREDDENNMPLSKIVVFTEHTNEIRRRGVAITIKNVSFDVSSHANLISSSGSNLLPYLLLPLMGSETYPDDESDAMPDELQLLPPDKEREKDVEILKTHLDTLLLLSTSRKIREEMRKVQVYPIVRECHAEVENEDVRDACDRLVQILMRDEAMGDEDESELAEVQAEDDEDMQIVDVIE